MPERTRTILAFLRKYFSDRRWAERRKVRLPFTVSLTEEKPMKTRRPPQSIEGHTLDISTSGLALIVPAIRIGDHYLAGENRALLVKLELPVGPIEIQATPVRYERLDEDQPEMGYLIGVSITRMSDSDRVRYDEYVASLLKE